MAEKSQTEDAAKAPKSQAERDTATTAVEDPGAVPRSDGWTTDTTPEAQPQRVIEDDARRAKEAQEVLAGNRGSPDRAMAPGAMEYSEEQRDERAKAMEDKRLAQEKAGAEQQAEAEKK